MSQRLCTCALGYHPLCLGLYHHLEYFTQNAVGRVPHTSQDGVIAVSSVAPVRRRGILAYTRYGVTIGECQEQACTSTSYAARYLLSVNLREGRFKTEKPTLQYPCVPAVRLEAVRSGLFFCCPISFCCVGRFKSFAAREHKCRVFSPSSP